MTDLGNNKPAEGPLTVQHDTFILDENGGIIASTVGDIFADRVDAANTARLVQRFNLYPELVTTLKYVVSAADLYELDRAKACARILLAKCEAQP